MASSQSFAIGFDREWGWSASVRRVCPRKAEDASSAARGQLVTPVVADLDDSARVFVCARASTPSRVPTNANGWGRREKE